MVEHLLAPRRLWREGSAHAHSQLLPCRERGDQPARYAVIDRTAHTAWPALNPQRHLKQARREGVFEGEGLCGDVTCVGEADEVARLRARAQGVGCAEHLGERELGATSDHKSGRVALRRVGVIAQGGCGEPIGDHLGSVADLCAHLSEAHAPCERNHALLAWLKAREGL